MYVCMFNTMYMYMYMYITYEDTLGVLPSAVATI